MINMKKQVWRAGALCLAGVVALSVTGVSVYAKTSEKKETEIKEQIQDAVSDIWKSEDTTAASIDETVYVILDADGTQQKIYVSDWLKNQGDKDSYTQSTPDKDAPISVKITYLLDGNEIAPADLVGKSGHVTIRYDYTNEVYETREIAGQEEKIYVPFAVMTGMILDNDVFSNIQVSSGKVINDGSHSVVTGIVFPGLGTSLDMEDDFDDYLEIEADVESFTMTESYCIATNSVFSRLDLSNMDDLDDLKAAMNDLDDATMQLMDGSSELYDGVSELYDKSGDLKDGVKELSDGSADLRDGAYKLADGTVTLRDGIGALKSGSESLQSGTNTLFAGTQSLQAGTNDLKTGLGQLAAQNDTLNGAAAQVFNTILATANTSLDPLISSGLMPALTIDNYAEVLPSLKNTLAYLSTEEGARQLVLKQSGHTMDEYNTWATIVAAAGATTPAPSEDKTNDTVPSQDSVSDSDAITDTYDTTGTDDATDTDNVAEQSTPISQEETTPSTPSITPEMVAAAKAALTQVNEATSTLKATASSAAGQIPALEASLTGYGQFYAGLQAYTAGVASASAGANKLADGTTQVVSGASQLKDGADKLVSGSKNLLDGANTLIDGSRNLASGAGTLANGVNTLSDGSDALIDGIRQLRDGAKELKDGIVQFNDEGISKLTELDTDELQEVIDRMKATASVSENYNSFTGSNDGMDSSVKFIYKISAVK